MGDELDTVWSPLPVIGYRTWQLTHPGGPVMLVGHFGGVWETSTLEAACRAKTTTTLASREIFPSINESLPQTHEVPDPNCECGIYAHKNSYLTATPGITSGVTGRVLMTGKIIEGTMGYRAKYVHMDCLIAAGNPRNNRDQWMYRQLRNRYASENTATRFIDSTQLDLLSPRKQYSLIENIFKSIDPYRNLDKIFDKETPLWTSVSRNESSK